MTEFIDAWVQTIKTARDDGDLDTYVRKIFEEGVNIATEAVQENPEEYELRRIRTAIPPLGSKSREFANKQDAEEFLAGVLRDHRERVRLNTKSG